MQALKLKITKVGNSAALQEVAKKRRDLLRKLAE
jgi:hypothetical protein